MWPVAGLARQLGVGLGAVLLAYPALLWLTGDPSIRQGLCGSSSTTSGQADLLAGTILPGARK